MKYIVVLLLSFFIFPENNANDPFSKKSLNKTYGPKLGAHLNQLVTGSRKKKVKIRKIWKESEFVFIERDLSPKFCEQRSYRYDKEKDKLYDMEDFTICN